MSKTDPRAPSPAAAIANAAERLLDREAPDEYLAAWERSLAKPLALGGASEQRPYLYFRVGEERFVLAAENVREVHRPGRVHEIPGRSNDVFRGLVCLRGELHLCASLHALFGVAATAEPSSGTAVNARMVVIERGADVWAFAADEVMDVRRAGSDAVVESPTTIAKSLVHYTDGIIDLGGDARPARISPTRLFDGLARRLA